MFYKNLKKPKSKSNVTLVVPLWQCDIGAQQKQNVLYKNLCLLSVIFAFIIGLLIGIFIPMVYLKDTPNLGNITSSLPLIDTNRTVASESIKNIFIDNSYSASTTTKTILESTKTFLNFHLRRKEQHNEPAEINEYPTVSFVDNVNNVNTNEVKFRDSVVENGIYWGEKVERSLPEGFDWKKHQQWSEYVKSGQNVAVKLETGCGRMQNRLVTFHDGTKGCVRYRQNTDQIQGELFSFYLAHVLKLSNLAPSTVSIVNLKNPLWSNMINEISAAQWNSNRPVVITKFINNLDTASIPSVFKPEDKHLNKNDIFNMTLGGGTAKGNENLSGSLVELAQWSDLIVFDYLTGNLDRVVNNLYNYQWNVNIMEAPAHNLARKLDTDLLIFLDNESGLLHGYRLLKKYEIYHTILLDNLCLFRKSTANVIEELQRHGNVGAILRNMFDRENDGSVKDVLPTLPDKSVKILNERIEKVYNQIQKCKIKYGVGVGGGGGELTAENRNVNEVFTRGYSDRQNYGT